jgi:hypothetical protein
MSDLHIPNRKGAPFRALAMDSETEIGVVRYDGDPDVFTALAWALAIAQDSDYAVQPPQPRLYRCNPEPTGEYAWWLTPAQQRGRGVFLGATVRPGRYFEPEWARRMTALEAA